MSAQCPAYQDGVTLTRDDVTQEWCVITDDFHPHGADIVRYPTHRDAREGFRLSVKAATA